MRFHQPRSSRRRLRRCGNGAQPKAPNAGGSLNSEQGKRSLESAWISWPHPPPAPSAETTEFALITLSEIEISVSQFAPMNGPHWKTLSHTRAKKKTTWPERSAIEPLTSCLRPPCCRFKQLRNCRGHSRRIPRRLLRNSRGPSKSDQLQLGASMVSSHAIVGTTVSCSQCPMAVLCHFQGRGASRNTGSANVAGVFERLSRRLICQGRIYKTPRGSSHGNLMKSAIAR